MNHIIGHGFCGVMAGLLVLSIGLPEDTNTALAADVPDTAESLALPVPRTFELTHVRPEPFAVALGKDPERIFAFVRDQVAYEVYTGYLRGPRGTLLAMAGNSVDQAALLGSLLEHAGQRVRYVRGALSETAAKTLVDSMWAERPRPTPAKSELAPEVKAALDTLRTNVERDYRLIRNHLKRAGHEPGPEAVTSLASLVEEAQSHYWVQWLRDGTWVDLDPSFGGASIGKTFASAGPPFKVFPKDLFHRVEIRVRLEEYTGDQSSERVILRHSVKAAELSGVDLALSHQPENWKGPANSLQGALTAAIADTGRIKPVLFIGARDWKPGEPFRQRPPGQGGLGSIKGILSGAGTREPVPIATAEWIEFDFVYPGVGKETVVREILDLAGKARRLAGVSLTSDEVRGWQDSGKAFDLTSGIYDLFFTTGRVEMAHLSGISEDRARQDNEPQDVRSALRNVNLLFALSSDAVMRRLKLGGEGMVLVYPDSPRLLITELVRRDGTLRFSLDLRRDRARTTPQGESPAAWYFVRLFRGIVEGTLERVLVEFLFSDMRDSPLQGAAMSTSALFEWARAQGVRSVMLPRDAALLDYGAVDDARARIQEQIEAGDLIVAPERGIEFAGAARTAWWRISARSGKTTAVTDEGLYQTSTEFVHIEDESTGEVHVFYRQGSGSLSNLELRYVRSFSNYNDFRTFWNGVDATTRAYSEVWTLLSDGTLVLPP